MQEKYRLDTLGNIQKSKCVRCGAFQVTVIDELDELEKRVLEAKIAARQDKLDPEHEQHSEGSAKFVARKNSRHRICLRCLHVQPDENGYA
jgi:ribosomal protein L40E